MLEIFIYNLINYILPVTLAGFFFGIVSFPIGQLFFKRFPDKGYNIGKIFGLFSISLIYFTLVTISSFLPMHFLKLNSFVSIFVSIFIWIIIQTKISPKFNFITEIKNNYRSILIYELFFLLIVTLYFSLHTFNNNLVGESQMNIAILNTLQNSEKLPIKDFWLSGENFNYYYFGHILLNLILSLTFKNPNDFYYALASFMPSLLALSFFSLLKQMLIDLKITLSEAKYKIYSILGVLILLLTSTLNSVSLLLNSVLSLNLNEEIFLISTTARSLPYTVTENYSYTFVYIPIHAHVFGLLIGIVLIYLYYEFFKFKGVFSFKNLVLIAICFFLGMSYMTNTWDFIFYFFLFHFLYFRERLTEIKTKFKMYFINLSVMIYITILVSISWLLFYQPPALHLELVEYRSPIISWIGVWGFYLLCIGSGWILIKLYKIKIASESFFYNLFSYCFLVIIFMEIIFIKDATQHRFNTYYKFSNQIFLIFTLIASIGLAKIFEYGKRKYLKVVFIIFFCLTLTGTFFTIKRYTKDGYYKKATNLELVVKNYNSDTYEGLQFMKTLNLKNKVILEGVDGVYNNTNFFSALLGTYSYLGWTNHEYTWRTDAKYIPMITNRKRVVETIYTNSNLDRTIDLLKENKIDYIIIGKSEIEIYGSYLKTEKLTKTGKIVFQKPEFILIEVNK